MVWKCRAACIGLVIATSKLVVAQEVDGDAELNATVVTSDTTVYAQKDRTRWALHPFIGVSTAVTEGEFAISNDFTPYPRPLVGGKIMVYPSGYPQLSWELSAYFQWPLYDTTRLSQMMLAFNSYMSDSSSQQKRRHRPFLSVGLGRLADDLGNSALALQLGGGIEIAADSPNPGQIGIYWVKSSETNRLFYVTIGINLFQN